MEAKHKKKLCDEYEYVATIKVDVDSPQQNVRGGANHPCDNCDFVATTSSKLKVHIRKEHAEEYIARVSKFEFQCDSCEKMFELAKQLKRHKEKTCSGKLTPYKTVFVDGKKMYGCRECDYIGAESGFYGHRDSKHLNIRHPCDQCEYSAATKRDLRRHVEARHMGVRYKCDLCDFTTTAAGYIKVHTEAKHSSNTYQCDQCIYIGSSQHHLNAHMHIHNKPDLVCGTCDFTAKSEAKIGKAKNMFKSFVFK